MVLKFKSDGATEIVIIEREADGTQRVARARQDDSNPKQWHTQLEHPVQGAPPNIRQCSNVYGSRGDVGLALTHYLNETAIEWMQEKASGHRPQSRPRDLNVRVDELGQTVDGPPIHNYLTRK